MKKQLTGVVKSDKMVQTAVITISRLKAHPKYKKRTTVKKSYLADNQLKAKTGDQVILEETKPISKNKHFQIIKIIKT